MKKITELGAVIVFGAEHYFHLWFLCPRGRHEPEVVSPRIGLSQCKYCGVEGEAKA